MQNGLIITNSVQTPYVIDPNSQALKWLQSNLRDRPLEVREQLPHENIPCTTLNAERFARVISPHTHMHTLT
jgi:hypothetical protein